MGIIIFGLNGSGKSTLGNELALQLRYKHMDIEDYFFSLNRIFHIQRNVQKMSVTN